MSSKPTPPAERLKVRIRHVEGLPVVAVRVWLRGGARCEAVPGEALLTGRLLAEGSRRRDYWQVVRDAEDQGMVLQSFGTYESIGVAIDAMARDWQDALAWAAETLFEPVFPDDRFEFLRRHALGELESLLDQPEVRAGRAFLEHLYAPHPYCRALQGDAASLERLTAADCAAFHRRSLDWGGMVIVTGTIDEEAVAERVRELFGGLRGPATPLPAIAGPLGQTELFQKILVGANDQAHVFAGQLTVPRQHEDTEALSILGVVLGAGAGMSGRLPERIRERQGLAYNVDVSTFAGAGLDAGRLAIYVGTSPDAVDQTLEGVRQELEQLVEHGVDDQEMEAARSYLIGREAFRRETARQWADVLAEAEFYDLETDRYAWLIDRLQSLTRAEVNRAARRWVRPRELRVTVGVPR